MEEESSELQPLPSYQRWWNSPSCKIYFCHTVSSWSDRMWGFAVSLYMVILFPQSLLLTAIYGFSNCLSIIILGPYIGGWIDKTRRITAAKYSVVMQNSAVVVNAAILTTMLYYRSEIEGKWDGHLQNLLYAMIIIVAIIAELASVANKIALEKDWIVVLAGGDNLQLARLNSVMRTINLLTYILAPVAVGQIIEFTSPEIGAMFIAVWNVVSAVIEYYLLMKIYKIVPQLGIKGGKKMSLNEEERGKKNTSEERYHNEEDKSTPQRRSLCLACDGWKSYFSHQVLFAGLGLACLYTTVLGFDSVTIGFLYSQGISGSFISILTAIGAVFGILGSVSFPLLRRVLGKNKNGILGFTMETLTLVICVVSVFIKGSPFKWESIKDRFEGDSSYESHPKYSFKEIWENVPHVVVFMTGLVLGRFGLWVADLSVTQIFQEEVEETERGIINGTQDSLNKFMDLIKYAMVILLPDPETFGYLIFVSWIFVFLGFLSFVTFVSNEKKKKKKKRSPVLSIFSSVSTISAKLDAT